MKTDKYGQLIFTENDLCELYLQNNDLNLKNVLTEDNIVFDPILELEKEPNLIKYNNIVESILDFDDSNQKIWFFPDEYKNMDIAKWVLDQCKTDEELQRAGKELILFQERNMFILLKYLKYLVDKLRENNIVWGVGRGSSVASFVLYLIGVHKINSLYYDLNINEFLK